MSVSLNPNINFTSYRLPDSVVEKAKEQAKAENNTLAMSVLDQCQFEADKKGATDKHEKKPGKLKKAIASVAKFFTATEEITKGTAKGAVYGTMTGIGCLAAGWLFNALPKGFKKGGSLKQVFKQPLKSMSTPVKVVSALAAAGVAVYHVIRGKLQANQRNAFVDQKLRMGN